MQEASEKVWSQSVVHYHFKLKNEILFMCVTKPSGVGMQFLVLEFLSSAQLDHTSMYNFESLTEANAPKRFPLSIFNCYLIAGMHVTACPQIF